MFCIAIDAMGGDFGPRVTVKAAISALARHPQLQIKLLGDLSSINPLLSKPQERLILCHTSDVIPADSSVSQALREKGDTSMRRSLEMVQSGEADAVLSAGNTGALMALSRRLLGTIEGIDRPAITAAVPTLRGQCQVLDLGANIDCSAEMLWQFAVLGAALVEVDLGLSRPRVGLLNIGAEQTKGTDNLRAASALIEQLSGIEYIGFVEGDDLYAGRADLVICDGLIGNVALKSSEGLARLIDQKVRYSFKRSWYRRLLSFLALPILADLKAELDTGARNGALFLGLKGLVIKSHGSASESDFGHAIDQAYLRIKQQSQKRLMDSVAQRIRG